MVLLLFFGTERSSALAALSPNQQGAPYPGQPGAVEKAVQWLVVTHQNEDGGFTSFSMGADQAASDVGGTLDAILAIAAAGFNPAAAAEEGKRTPIEFLRANPEQLDSYSTLDGAQAGKLVLALVASNQDPRNFEGVDYVAQLMSHHSFSGEFGVAAPFGHSLAILALSAAYEPIPQSAVDWLVSRQAAEGDVVGSWDDGFGTAGNADATAISVMALGSTGLTSTVPSQLSGLDFLVQTRLESGGWEYGPGLGENAISTALVIQALSSAGHDFYTPDANGVSSLDALLAWQGESGAFQADFGDGPFDDFLSTVQSLPAATGKGMPIKGRFQAALRAVECLDSLQDTASGGWEQFATFGVNAAGTSRAVQAIAAVGEDPRSPRWTVEGISAVQYLEDAAAEYAAVTSGGGLGVLVQAVVAAGADPRDFGGVDLTLSFSQHLSPTGEYDDTSFGPFSHAETMLGLYAAGEPIDPSAVEWLLDHHDSGDWGGPDSTGISLQILAKLGDMVPESLEALRNSQELDGGWGFGSANPSSSSEVVQGLVAAGENPFGPAWSQVLSGTLSSAADAVMKLQGQNGCWPNLFGPGDDPFATTDAVLLLVQNPSWEPIREMSAAVPALISEEGGTSQDPEEVAEPTASLTEVPSPEPTVPAAAPGPTAEITDETETVVQLVEETAVPQPTTEPSLEPDEGVSSGNLLTVVVVAAVVLALVAAGYRIWVRREA
jgi:hypothetical protein